MSRLSAGLRQLRQYPTAVIGLIVIGLLLVVSIITPIYIPYSEAVRLWRGGETVWREYPRNAAPAWRNWFTSTDLAASIILRTEEGDVEPVYEQVSADTREARFTFEFDFPYDTFPPELIMFASAQYEQAALCRDALDNARRPGDPGRGFSPGASSSVRFDQDSRLQRRLERETGLTTSR